MRPTHRIAAAGATLVRRCPASLLHLGILCTTTVILGRMGAPERLALLRSESTNLHNMAGAPHRVLLSSTVWVGGTSFTWVPRFVVVMVLAEWLLGTGRYLLIATAGHVGASLATTLAIWRLDVDGHASPDLVRAVDVGVSYGVWAVLAALVARLPRRARPLVALLLLAGLGAYAVPRGGTFTDYGHLVAATIGIACWPLVLRSTDEGSRKGRTDLPRESSHGGHPGRMAAS